jgi:hypothetical protein
MRVILSFDLLVVENRDFSFELSQLLELGFPGEIIARHLDSTGLALHLVALQCLLLFDAFTDGKPYDRSG